MPSPVLFTSASVTSDDEEKDIIFASQLVNAVVFPMVFHNAIQLDLFEIMARFDLGGGMSAKDIAAKLPTGNQDAPAMLDRMLCLLASHDVLRCSASENGNDRVYKLAPVCKHFCKNGLGVSLGPFADLVHDKVAMDCWYKLKDAVLEGGVPFDKTYGISAFEYPAQDQSFNQVFNAAMHNHTTMVMADILEGYKGFEHIEGLVDVGGGIGTSLGMITSKYPKIKGINFDLGHVIEHAPSYPGVEHVVGDMFESVPKGDAILMKFILHDWTDGHCLKVLKNCYKALPDHGKVIVVETNLPDIPDTSNASKAAAQFDLGMLLMNPGGKERRAHEFLAMAKEAGFSGIKYQGCFGLFWVMEFFK